MTPRRLGLAALAGASAIWGGMYVATAALMRTTPPLVVLELRELIAALVLVPVARRRGRVRLARADWWRLVLTSVVGFTVSIGLQLEGTHVAGAALGSLITASSPVVIALLGVVWLGERLSLVRLLAIVVAVGGVALIAGRPPGGAHVSIGVLELSGAALAWSVYTVSSAELTRRYGALSIVARSTAIGAVSSAPLAIVSALRAAHPLPSGSVAWAEVAYISVAGMAVAFWLWNWGFRVVDAAAGGAMLLAQPLVGVLLGVALLDEPTSASLVVGGLLVMVGVLGAIVLGARDVAATAQVSATTQRPTLKP